MEAASLTVADIIVCLVYLVATVWVGLWAARRRNVSTTENLFLAGRAEGWLPVGISVLAALFSGITMLGAPGETYSHGLAFIMILASFFLATPLTIAVFLPLLHLPPGGATATAAAPTVTAPTAATVTAATASAATAATMTAATAQPANSASAVAGGVPAAPTRRTPTRQYVSAYEYLERRFALPVRLVASALFITRVSLYLAVATWAPALALATVSPIPIWLSVLVTCIVSASYTVAGGMAAVIWTDVLQTVILGGGVVLVAVLSVAWTPGGLQGCVSRADSAGLMTVVDWDLSLASRSSVWSLVLGGALYNSVQLATDQTTIQRLLSTATRRDAEKVLWTKLALLVPFAGLSYASGVTLYSYYAAKGMNLLTPAANSTAPILESPDMVFPYFAVSELPSPLPGLLIAAILAATMSTISSGLNALATATVVDFGERLGWMAPRQPRHISLLEHPAPSQSSPPPHTHQRTGQQTTSHAHTEVQHDTQREDTVPADNTELGTPAPASASGETAAASQRMVRVSQVVTAVYCVVVIALTMLAGGLDTLNAVVMIMNGSAGGPLLGLFLLGMTTYRADTRGALVGAAVGAAVMLSITVLRFTCDGGSGCDGGGVVDSIASLSFVWYAGVGATLTYTVGFAASRGAIPRHELVGLVLDKWRAPWPCDRLPRCRSCCFCHHRLSLATAATRAGPPPTPSSTASKRARYVELLPTRQ